MLNTTKGDEWRKNNLFNATTYMHATILNASYLYLYYDSYRVWQKQTKESQSIQSRNLEPRQGKYSNMINVQRLIWNFQN